MSDLPSHGLAELWQDATCPESGKSQHDTTAPGSSTTQDSTAPHHTARRLFTAWVRLLVFKDTVALFQYGQTLGRFF